MMMIPRARTVLSPVPPEPTTATAGAASLRGCALGNPSGDPGTTNASPCVYAKSLELL
jgi:hypothetical protein